MHELKTVEAWVWEREAEGILVIGEGSLETLSPFYFSTNTWVGETPAVLPIYLAQMQYLVLDKPLAEVELILRTNRKSPWKWEQFKLW